MRADNFGLAGFHKRALVIGFLTARDQIGGVSRTEALLIRTDLVLVLPTSLAAQLRPWCLPIRLSAHITFPPSEGYRLPAHIFIRLET